MNAREKLIAVTGWLEQQNDSLSFGLRNSMDALRLYDYAQATPRLPAMLEDWTAEQRGAVLGYDPLKTDEGAIGRKVGEPEPSATHQRKAVQGREVAVVVEGKIRWALWSVENRIEEAGHRWHRISFCKTGGRVVDPHAALFVPSDRLQEFLATLRSLRRALIPQPGDWSHIAHVEFEHENFKYEIQRNIPGEGGYAGDIYMNVCCRSGGGWVRIVGFTCTDRELDEILGNVAVQPLLEA